MKNVGKIAVLFIWSILLFNCSNDDDASNTEGQDSFSDVLIVSQDQNNIFQINITNSGQDIIEENLNQSLNLQGTNYFLDVKDNLLSFLSRQGWNINLIQKNIDNLNITTRQPICSVDDDEYALSATIADDAVIVFSQTADEADPKYFIRTFYKSFQQCNFIEIGEDAVVGGKLVQGNFLYHTIARSDDTFGIIKRDIQSMQIIASLFFDDVFKATFNDNDELLVFSPNDTLMVFEVDSFEERAAYDFEYTLITEDLGLFETDFVGTEIFVDISYPQPNRFTNVPATIDYTTGDFARGNSNYILDLQNNLDGLGLEVLPSVYAVDEDNNQLVFGARSVVEPSKGALIYSNFEGELLHHINLESVPFSLVVR